MSVDQTEIDGLLDVITRWKDHMIDYDELDDPPQYVNAISDNDIYIYYTNNSFATINRLILNNAVLGNCTYKSKKNNIIHITRICSQ